MHSISYELLPKAGRKVGIVLPVVIVEHCFTKNSLSIEAFVCTFVTDIPFSRRGGILITFFLLSNLLKTVHVNTICIMFETHCLCRHFTHP